MDGRHAGYGHLHRPSPALLLFVFVVLLCFSADAYAHPLKTEAPSGPSHSIGLQSPVQQTIPCCATLSGTLKLQGRTDHSGIQVQMWPGTGLRATTDHNGHFSIVGIPATANENSSEYTLSASVAGYLGPQTTIDLRTYLVDENTTVHIPFSEIWLLGGELNNDNRVNIFDLVIVGSHYGEIGDSPGDVNDDGRVNIQDLAITAGNFGKQNNYVWAPQ